jgi:hypothetical protein
VATGAAISNIPTGLIIGRANTTTALKMMTKKNVRSDHSRIAPRDR